MATSQAKMQHLEDILRQMGSVAVAYSAGVDSTFLLKTAHDLLGDRAIAVTARSPLSPDREQSEGIAFCKAEKIPLVTVDFDPFSVAGFAGNPPDRCYLCKRALFSHLCAAAAAHGVSQVAEGSNQDDLSDYRPGLRAVAELGVHSPLREAGLTKAEIRQLSKDLGLPTWNKPSFACLASRFAYGETITAEKLAMVEQAEEYLLERRFHQVRVRVHGSIARIEILPTEFAKILEPVASAALHQYFRSLGFSYVTLDLGGYQTGSMNRALPETQKEDRPC